MGSGTPRERMKLVRDADLREIDRHLDRRLDGLLVDADGLAPMKRAIRDYVLAGGKRVRPQLCLWTFERLRPTGVSDATLPEALLDVACGWELFHAFLLAHDDIIDESDVRRDQPALHRQLAALDSYCPKFGKNLAIVAGDLLFSAAMRLWHELDVPAETYRSLLRLFGRVASTTGFGQAIDICQSHVPIHAVREEVLLREYHWKTAAYTFEGPMLSGAILASANDLTLDAISSYALALGQAYQLQNDLIDLSTPVHDGCDLVQGKRTVTLVRARAGLLETRRQAFDRQVEAIRHANGHTAELAEALRRELLDSGAAERTRELVAQFLSQAAAAAERPGLPLNLQNGMSDLLAALRSQYFAVA